MCLGRIIWVGELPARGGPASASQPANSLPTSHFQGQENIVAIVPTKVAFSYRKRISKVFLPRGYLVFVSTRNSCKISSHVIFTEYGHFTF